MRSNLNTKTNQGSIDSILADEEELIPSSGFLAATMERSLCLAGAGLS
jgi:hypothetical protein